MVVGPQNFQCFRARRVDDPRSPVVICRTSHPDMFTPNYLFRARPTQDPKVWLPTAVPRFKGRS